MPLFSVALAPMLALQSAGQTPVAIKNDNPETWAVEYPLVITPFIQDYRRCLNVAIRYVTGVADFEVQHTSDVPRCADVREQAVAESKNALVGAKTRLSDEEIEHLFVSIGKIHIQRGRDLDQQFAMRIEAAERAAAEGPPPKPAPYIVDLPDPSVVKSREQTLSQ